MTVSRPASSVQIETKFLRLKTPVTLGSYFGDWRVTWLGGWTRGKLSYLVMVARVVQESGRSGGSAA
jgi:hypothetical protein